MARLTGRRGIAVGVLTGLVLAACAGANFPFKHYNIEVPQECYDRGTLLGPNPSDDLSLKVCQPDAQKKARCAITLRDEYERLKRSYLDLQAKLDQCEQDRARR